jgi:hypothetical protein
MRCVKKDRIMREYWDHRNTGWNIEVFKSSVYPYELRVEIIRRHPIIGRNNYTYSYDRMFEYVNTGGYRANFNMPPELGER